MASLYVTKFSMLLLLMECIFVVGIIYVLLFFFFPFNTDFEYLYLSNSGQVMSGLKLGGIFI